MQKYRHIIFILAVLLGSSASGLAQSSPQDGATQFYNAYIKLKPRGLPDRRQRRVLWPLLTADLRKMFAAAQREQLKFARAHPNEKPPWADGDLFSSLFEGANSFKLGEATVNDDYAEIPVQLALIDSRGDSRWTDTVLLKRNKNTWRVSDIIFGGEWQFKTGSSLRGVLKIEKQ